MYVIPVHAALMTGSILELYMQGPKTYHSVPSLPPSLPLSLQLSRSVARYHQEKELHHAKTEREELGRLRKIASTIAKEVKHFWDSIQKVGSN